ncbi:THO complex subunit 1 isoform X7 [Diospyros lotus]|uniref:THO complex subunit 1 isoform X1 n=2 Tax=Diospyros lotus TaxID=55363 RepID=UPI00224E1877|nr:THO complex subunit 1 isoform X1 [Diospyros lotus]XP_052176616.1 THO complex subunit 1 isoform X2 [Diospyros lotus]XP_052176619.1 THO complex subunit 1 isoform X3 [Diospyros lotus]XP_052176622.1 THO complex subunit 1 isoform X4 [Diospyros lotus]XP_052176624.1 THO complex subunit 1 isoform X5 [Diospyros lotus]XP_052176628.1 THO complex subunit 1 isoform X6 [Diospyros lotus]XP_052176633.1 THO complex subunit 1 isoform X7 [Diospyros lotus]
MDLFRRAILEPGPPETFALLTVQEAIKPQKQTKLVQDENQLLENILRTLLQELVSLAVQSGEKIMEYGQSIADGEANRGQIPRLLDIVLYLCENEHVEAGMIFQLLEDLTEMSTMRNCKDIFGYIESKQDILGKPELFARGKLVMLRTCNQLLRRLSKANDVVFCGRIIMFLAHFFPLSERSAVNIKGVFNTSNETKYEKEAPDGISIDFNFYKTFWSLQEYFCNPVSLNLAPIKWQKFTSSLMVVLNTFEAQPLSDEEGNANNLEDEAATFSIKYLTSSKLMGLELKDPSFRRHILVQCLILFDYLKAPGKTDKDLPSETMKEEIKSCEERVKKLLEMTPPKGSEFLHSIEHILERERNWVWWKRDGCPPFEKPSIENKSFLVGTKKRRPRWRLGNKELSQLWKWADQNPNALTDAQRVRTPAVTEYWKPLAEDMDESAGIEAEYHHKNNRVYCWKGLRFSARQDLEGFSRFTEYGIEGVVPLELLPPDARSKYQTKPSERSKRAKREETKGAANQAEESQIATPASETDGDASKADLEASAAPMDTDAAITTGSASQAGTPTPDEQHKQSSDTDGQEPGQIEAEAETGVIDGETDAEVDLIQ